MLRQLSVLLVGLIVTVFVSAQNSKRLVIRLSNGISIRSYSALDQTLKNQLPQLEQLMNNSGLSYRLTPIMTETELNALDQKTRKVSGPSAAVQSLWRTFNIDIENVADAQLNDLVAELRKLVHIDYCVIKSREIVPLPGDIAPTTPDISMEQDYMGPNPGVNINYALGLGIRGQGIRVRDVEVGVNVEHEELSEKNVGLAEGMTVNPSATSAYTEHGTAVVGIIMADSGSYGTTGMQHGADELVSFSIWTKERDIDITYGIAQAISNSEEGDIIMYELQAVGPNGGGNYVPQEWDPDVWDLTRAATDAGIVIVAAAGNGNQNLDNPEFEEYNLRGHSGAIIVGAGEADLTHSRTYFSTYGSRVDVQGWGFEVVSPGYGDLYTYGGDFNQQYTSFSGTSSATPIVTSCVIALQSYYHNSTGKYLSTAELRDLLVETGRPQTLDTAEHIGPLPNVELALKKLKANFISEENSKLNISLHPNPATSKLFLTSFSFAPKQSVSILNALGETISAFSMENTKEIDVSGLPQGVYFIQVDNGKEVATQKFVKN